MDTSGSRSLFHYIEVYMTEKQQMNERRQDRTSYIELRDKILGLSKATLKDWNSWKWQMANRSLSWSQSLDSLILRPMS